MMKRILSLLICMLLTFSMTQYVFAEETEEKPEVKTEENKEKKEENKEEKKEKTEEKKEEEGQLSANSKYVILADMNSGMTLYEKNSGERVYPADLTKVMTAVLVLENCKLEEIVTASETAISNVKTGDSKLGIVKEEKLSVRQLLYAMLLGSASDAANVLAEKTSGSIEEFVVLMNEKAKDLGMSSTNFTNPTGEHDERHYTTTGDMKKLAVYAMQNKDFREIVKCDSYTIPATEKHGAARKVVNRNHFVSKLSRGDYYYEYSTGIKTGYTPEAKSCIAASAEKDGMQLIALVFKAETVDNVAQSFKDCEKMFDYAFENYTKQDVISKEEIVAQINLENARRSNKLILKTDNELSVIKNKDDKDLKITYKDAIPEKLSAPIKKNAIIGTREYFIGKTSIGKVNLIADKDYALDPVSFVINKMIAFVTSPWLYVAIVVIIILLIMVERRRRRIRRKKRREARRKRTQEMVESMYS